jgi:hypothetical protein
VGDTAEKVGVAVSLIAYDVPDDNIYTALPSYIKRANICIMPHVYP